MGWLLFLPGAILLTVGAFGLLWPPARINWWYGYRTRRSMRSQEAWKETNLLAARLLMLAGILSLNTALTCWFLTRRTEMQVIIVAVVSCALALGIVAVVELGLSRNYDGEGRPRRKA